ncbi:MAG TPA: ATP-dependent 6-phosphofructokinase [Phycisphaerae bacterium]|nr:ATP-dependent 6-phosphofructokinase [Phycisphaerae bacterium]
MLTPEQLHIESLGAAEIPSPLRLSMVYGDGVVNYVPDATRVRYDVEVAPGVENRDDLLFEKAGPRENIYFDPANVRAAIVTCGGLSPGLNNVIRSIFLQLFHHYGLKDILGIRYGYQGLSDTGQEPVKLTAAMVDKIHRVGGTILGSSRCSMDPEKVVDFLASRGINVLFCIGGDGTQAGAHAIAEVAQRRGEKISIMGVPKTIDNDIRYVYRTFGFATAIDIAQNTIDCAHAEATGAPNCVALVKLMGRDAGFIAAGATVASQDVNFCLVPEVPFDIPGLLEALDRRLAARGHAVIVVAEGAGQNLLAQPDACDASGNRRYADIGLYLQQTITDHYKAEGLEFNLKYIDPSYTIRSVQANSQDQMLCDQYARYAVHAALAGKTDMLIGMWHNVFIHVPISVATAGKRHMSPESALWMAVLDATGQPVSMKSD